MNKAQIRKNILKDRDSLNEKSIRNKSKLIEERFLATDLYQKSNTIFSFISFGSEVHTHELIKKIIEDGKILGVPYTYPKNRKMIVSEIKDFDRDLERGYYNILSPRKEEIQVIDEKKIDLVLVPGLAFDKKGYRVGYGGGYYDSFFEKTRKDVLKVGICFDLQLIDSCPIGLYDIPVDYIITEKDLIKI